MKLRAVLLLMLMWTPLSWAERVWIDVRTPAEFNAGHLGVAKNIEYQNIVTGVKAMNLDKDAEILLYCRSGRRASFALSALQEAGYTNVQNLGTLEGAEGYQNSLQYR